MWPLIFTCALLNAPPNIPQYQAQTVNGLVSKGQLLEITGTGVLHVQDAKPIPVSEWVTLAQVDRPYPPHPKQPHLLFANGDCLVGEVVAGDGDALSWRPKIGEGLAESPLRFPISAIAIVWQKPIPVDEQPTWVTASRKRDVLQLKNGDVLIGSIHKIDLIHWRMTIDKREQDVPTANVVALGFNTDLARIRKPRGLYYRVVLNNGSRLSCSAVTADAKKVTLTTLFKESFVLPLAEVVSITVEQGKATALTELKPTQYDYQSFDGEKANWSTDRTVHGRPLQLRMPAGDSTFDRGLGIPAGATLTYTLAAKYSRFDAMIGMDITQGERGAAQVQLLFDGKAHELPRGGKLTVRDGILTLQIDVRGVKEMKVVIARSDGGFVQAAVNMVEARLLP